MRYLIRFLNWVPYFFMLQGSFCGCEYISKKYEHVRKQKSQGQHPSLVNVAMFSYPSPKLPKDHSNKQFPVHDHTVHSQDDQFRPKYYDRDQV